MKNEAGLRPMKLAFGSLRTSSVLRFTAATPTLHIRAANASLTKQWIYAILNPRKAVEI